MELVDFLTLYGIFNLGIHISMFLVSLSINKPTRDNFELLSDSESSDSECYYSDSEFSDPGDPDYTQPSDLKINLRKRKTI